MDDLKESAQAGIENIEAAMREQLASFRANASQTGTLYDDAMGVPPPLPLPLPPLSLLATARALSGLAHPQASTTPSTGVRPGCEGCSPSTSSCGCLRS